MRDDATGRERAAPTTVTTGPPTAAIAAGKALTPLPAIWYVSSDERLRKRGGAIMPRKRRVRKVGDGEPLRVDGYGRVSTEEQEKEGVSLVNQEQRIRDYCKLYGLNLVRMVTDPGVSAKTLDREGVQSVLDDLRRGHVAGLVITKLDRLTRSLGDWSSLIDEFFSKDAGLRLFSVNDSIDTGTASGLLVLDVLMSVAQWERRIIAERTSDAAGEDPPRRAVWTHSIRVHPWHRRKDVDTARGGTESNLVHAPVARAGKDLPRHDRDA